MSTCTREMDFFPANFMIQNHQHQEQEEQVHQFPHIQNHMLPPQDFHGTYFFFILVLVY